MACLRLLNLFDKLIVQILYYHYHSMKKSQRIRIYENFILCKDRLIISIAVLFFVKTSYIRINVKKQMIF